MKKQPATTIDKKITLREEQIKTAFAQIVDTIEKYFAIAPFEWLKEDGAEVGCKSFPEMPPTPLSRGRFDSCADHWMGQLLPEAHEVQRRLADRKDQTDEPGELAFAAEEYGFICGILVGSRYMGATREQLLIQCDAWAVPRLKWEQGRLTDEAERQAQK